MNDVYSANDLAVCIISMYEHMGGLIINLDLQVLLYLMWTSYYSITRKELFYDEFEAWKSGPAVDEVWTKYRRYVASPILTNESVRPHPDMVLIEGLIKYYFSKDIMELRRMVRVEGGPWDRAYAKGRGTIIGRKDIKKYLSENFY
jgi:uncharacterized phage-associated protein